MGWQRRRRNEIVRVDQTVWWLLRFERVGYAVSHFFFISMFYYWVTNYVINLTFRKPEPKFYRLACRRNDVRPDVVFSDDIKMSAHTHGYGASSRDG